MALIDTHCHINFDSYDVDRDALLQRARDVGVEAIINPAVDMDSSHAGIALSKHYDMIYSAVGIHPNSTADFVPSMIDELRILPAQPKVVSIGEIGLDYYWDKSPKDKQRQAFEAQLALAQEVNLPVIIHDREAHQDVIDILTAWTNGLGDDSPLKGRVGVLHSFSAPQEIAEQAVALGFYLGFTGPITFKKAEELRQIARTVPLDRVLIETDGPFLTPEPYRGKRNEPAYVYHVADRLASLHGMTTEQMGQMTTDNAKRLFRLDALI
jgi:TatD DNase family protein